jgi:hypothetical protein
MIQVEPVVDPESDPEDDPGKLLNVWLGELDNLKKVTFETVSNRIQCYDHNFPEFRLFSPIFLEK